MPSGGGSKLAVISVSMALLWIGVYWATPGRESAPISTVSGVSLSFGDAPEEAAAASMSPATNLAHDEPVIVTATETPIAQNATTIDEAMARVIPPKFEKYVVQYGDDAWSISKKLYGTSKHWDSVLKANSLADPTKFREGQTIRIPVDPKNVQGIAVDASGEPIDAEADDSVLQKSKATEYIVARGDTLSDISKAIYGKSSQWRRIRDANRGVVNEDGTNLRPGMVLKIPPPPASN